MVERNGNGGTTASVAIPSMLLSEQAVPTRPLLAAALAALGSDEDEMPDDDLFDDVGRPRAPSMESL
jgi:hypothetical protein